MRRSPEVGDRLGRYHLVQELGQGGMAVVFKAKDTTLGREVAIKIMLPHLWGESEYAKRFTREARAVAALHHPNIVEIFDYGEGEDDTELPGYIISEFVDGPNLREFIDENGCPFPEVAAMVARKLAESLQCAHDQGIIHRDLKPENVMIARGGRIVLTDFGIARITEGEAVTQTGAMLGSPAYMSPEQARGRKTDARSDLFSLGVVLYLLSTGQLPFPGKDPISTVLKILDGKYEPSIKRNPRIGRGLDNVIKSLLQVDRDRRPDSATQVKEALDRVLHEAGIDDVDAELARYFEQPGPFNQQLTTQVLERSLTLAHEARDSGDYARALAFCDRVLSFEPDHVGALELMERLSNAGRGHRVLILSGLAMLLCGVAAAGLFWHFKGGPAEPTSIDAKVEPRSADLRIVSPDTSNPDRGIADAPGPDLRRHRRPGPRPHSALRKRDARVVSVAPPDARPTPRVKPDLRPPPTHGQIVVAIGAWCDIYLNGRRVGRSPMRDRPLSVPPGTHEIICRQGKDGPMKKERVTIKAGERKILTGTVRPKIQVRLKLRHGDAIRVDGKVYHGPTLKLPASRRRVDVLRGGQVVAGKGGWVTFTRACTLVDEPSLRCR